MTKSPLFGRRIHFSGSIAADPVVAPAENVNRARDLVRQLTRELVARGALFVLPVDTEKERAGDGLPICFDWLIWETIHASLVRRPSNAPAPLVIAVEHRKTQDQFRASFRSCGMTYAIPTLFKSRMSPTGT